MAFSVLVVVALAEVRVAHLAARVDQVLGGPELVAPGAPRGVVVVLEHRIPEPVRGDRPLDVGGVVLEGELRRVHAHDREPAAGVARVPGPQVRQRAQAVDAGVGPEVHEHHASAQARQRQRTAARPVEPRTGAGEVRGRSQLGIPAARRPGPHPSRSATVRAGSPAGPQPRRSARAPASGCPRTRAGRWPARSGSGCRGPRSWRARWRSSPLRARAGGPGRARGP